MHDSKQVLVFPNGFGLDLEVCHLSDLLLYVSDIILHNNYTTLKVYTMVGDTPWYTIIHYGRQYTMAIVHHGRGRYTCTPWPRKVQCNASAYDKIKAFITEQAGLEMILFCIGVNTSDVSLICLFRSCFYVFLSDRYTVKKHYFNRWRQLDLSQTSIKHLICTQLPHWLWYQLLKTATVWLCRPSLIQNAHFPRGIV